MSSYLPSVLAIVASYLLGSLSFAVIVSKSLGLSDPRSYGSKNPGATNVLRSGNKGAALATLVLDALKGWAPVFLVNHFGGDFGMGATTSAVAALAGLAAFLGHLYPIFFGFQGGKGVATAAGVILALNPILGAATLVTWLIIAYFSRFSSLASLVSAGFAPVYEMLIWGTGPIVGVLVVMGLLLVWRHSANIKKLLNGTESKLGQKPAAAPGGNTKKHPHGPAAAAAPGHSQPHPKKKAKKS